MKDQIEKKNVKKFWLVTYNRLVYFLKTLYILLLNYYSGSANIYYKHLGNDVLLGLSTKESKIEGPLWLNLGFWKKARNYPDACADLTRYVAQAAQFSSEDLILDVGFGYADQDILWAKEYQLNKIIGINITESQVELAKKRVAVMQLTDKIDLLLGSATNLPFADNTFDKVIALECAFHFSTREIFFEEAYRVLKPNGRLITADMLPSPTTKGINNLLSKIHRRAMYIPDVNMYDRFEYVKKLERQGFKNVNFESISNHVFSGMCKYIVKRLQGEKMTEVRIELSEDEIENITGVEVWRDYIGFEDYLIFTAEKLV